MLSRFLLITVFFFGPLHAAQLYAQQNPPPSPRLRRTGRTVTIWVHGSRTLSKLFFPTFFHVIPGLHRAHNYSEGNNLHTITTTLSASDPTAFPLEDMYLFGWSGTLGFQAHQQAAQQLYNQLVQLRDQYKKQYPAPDGVTPHLRIITHSHGGTIVQLLPTIETEKKEKLKIEELILLACPVQKKTAPLINDPLFKQIYSFYSRRDRGQIADPQGLRHILASPLLFLQKLLSGNYVYDNVPFFSERRFVEQKNMVQAEVTKNGRGLTHLDFILKEFVGSIAHVVKQLKKYKHQSDIPIVYKNFSVTYRSRAQKNIPAILPIIENFLSDVASKYI